MTGNEALYHGGRLNEAARTRGIPRAQWLDLSTGINPNGWPVPEIPAAVWQRLPEDDDGLDGLIRQWLGAPPAATCLPIPGSQWAIQTLPQLRPACRVGVPCPGYAEHGHQWALAGHQVVPVTWERLAQGDQWLAELDVLVWINPNNPTGQQIPYDRLLAWHRCLAARGGWLVVDEAFADGLPEHSVGPYTGQPGLILLRSLGKFFGLAGARAGAVVADPALVGQLRQRLGPWGLSGPARFVMAAALADRPWQQATTRQLQADNERLVQLLQARGLAPAGGSLLFQYVRTEAAEAIHQGLARQGILVRYFDTPTALRFGLPGKEAEWERLEQALSRIPGR